MTSNLGPLLISKKQSEQNMNTLFYTVHIHTHACITCTITQQCSFIENTRQQNAYYLQELKRTGNKSSQCHTVILEKVCVLSSCPPSLLHSEQTDLCLNS